MAPVCLAIMWHQHQPSYRAGDSVVGRLPWVRLHGIKDYVGMALLAHCFPEFHHTINLVPCLLDQIEDLAAGTASDLDLDLTTTPADELSAEEAVAVLDLFFMANIDTIVRPHARYAELLGKRALGRRRAASALRDFSAEDLRDLQVWHTLAWFHPLVVEQRQDVRDLVAKGRGFSEEDKAALAAAQQEVLRQIIPLHKRLQDDGSVELTTSPRYHPILPLLFNMQSARVALPGLPLPAESLDGAADAVQQIAEGVQSHARRFGRKPRGFWPSEGSVSPEMVAPVAEAGNEWMASDEDVLGLSLGVREGRGGRDVAGPDWLYGAYELAAGEGRTLAAVFRDHVLSDRIGFHYAHAPDGEAAAADLLARIKSVRSRDAARPALVAIIMDGENAWEYYPEQGMRFLTALYRGACRDKAIQPVTVSEYLDAHGPMGRLERLHSGSWIGANFATWVGQTEKDRGWELLARAKAAVEAAALQAPAGALAEARNAIHRAEGSDWFWWYGEGHSSEQEDVFDELFRAHLRAAYQSAGLPVRDEVEGVISEERPLYRDPEFLQDVTVDGQVSSYYEWLDAGYYDSRRDVGAMQPAGGLAVSQLYFAYCVSHFLLRLDRPRPAGGAYGMDWGVRLVFSNGRRVTLAPDEALSAPAALTVSDEARPGWEARTGTAARGHVVELAVPWVDLALHTGDEASFHVEVFRGEEVIQKLPRDSVIIIVVPGADFGAMDWTA